MFARIILALTLALGLQSSAQARGSHDGSFGEPIIACNPLPVQMAPGTSVKVTVYSNDATRSNTGKGAALVRYISADTSAQSDIEFNAGILTGKYNAADVNLATFTSNSTTFRLSLTTGKKSTLKLEGFNSDTQQWETEYNGPAECGVIQYESIGVHN